MRHSQRQEPTIAPYAGSSIRFVLPLALLLMFSGFPHVADAQNISMLRTMDLSDLEPIRPVTPAPAKWQTPGDAVTHVGDGRELNRVSNLQIDDGRFSFDGFRDCTTGERLPWEPPSPEGESADIERVDVVRFGNEQEGWLRFTFRTIGPPVEEAGKGGSSAFIPIFYDLLFNVPDGPATEGPGAPPSAQLANVIVTVMRVGDSAAYQVFVKNEQGSFEAVDWPVVLGLLGGFLVVDVPVLNEFYLRLSYSLTWGAMLSRQTGPETAVCDGNHVDELAADRTTVAGRGKAITPEKSIQASKNVTVGEPGSDEDKRAQLGQFVEFEIIIENTGSTTLNNIRVLDGPNSPFNIPALRIAEDVLFAPPGSACSLTGIAEYRLFECTIGSLGPEETWTLRFDAFVAGYARQGTAGTGIARNTVIAIVDEIHTSDEAEINVEDELTATATSIDSEVVLSKNSSHRDLYLNGELFADDLAPGDRVVVEHYLETTSGLLVIVDSDDPDDSNPLDTVFVDFLKRDTFELSDTYDVTIAADVEDSLVAVVVPDVRQVSTNPSQADLRLIHTGGRLSPVSVSEYESLESPLATGLQFNEWTDYSTHDPGLTFIEVSADDQSVYDVFAVTLEAGKAYTAHVSATRADPPQLLMSVADAGGNSVAAQVVTGVEESTAPDDAGFTLSSNYPDPFTDRTTIEFESGDAGEVSLVVFDLLGRQVRRLYDGAATGSARFVFEANDLPPGVYFYVLEAGSRRIIRTMTLSR